jgi:hypothetical protein
MGAGVVRGESSVGVPLRRLFRYEWMDVTNVIGARVTLAEFVKLITASITIAIPAK